MTLQPRHLSFALLLHAVLLALLMTSVQCSRRVQAPPVVQGVLINPSKVPVPIAPEHPAQQLVAQPQPDVAAQLKAQQAQAEAAQQKAQQEAQQKAQQEAALHQQQIEQQRQAEALKQQQAAAAEAQRQAQIKQQQEQAEAQRKADELRKQQQAAEQARQQAQAELQKQLEAEESQKRQAAAAAAKRAAERKQALAEMQDQLGVEDAKVRQQEQLSWGDMLTDAIEKVWSRPAGLQGLYCTIHIDLAPNGQVLNASVTKSSGNTLFDQSAQGAVYRASPLPLPQDMSAFQPSINVLYDPDKVAPQ